jgi:hypothetical protein
MCNHHADKVETVKCPTCHEEHDLPRDGFRTNKLAKSLLEDEVYLNEEQRTAKRSIKETALGFERKMKDFISKNSNFECDSFKSIQREIEIHRLQLKVAVCKQIDDKVLKLTQQVEEKRKAFVMSQHEAYRKIFEYEFKSVVNAAEEQFRQPNVVMANVNRLKDEQEKKMRDIQSKIAKFQLQIDRVKSFSFSKNAQTIDIEFGTLNLANITKNKSATYDNANSAKSSKRQSSSEQKVIIRYKLYSSSGSESDDFVPKIKQKQQQKQRAKKQNEKSNSSSHHTQQQQQSLGSSSSSTNQPPRIRLRHKVDNCYLNWKIFDDGFDDSD